MEQIVGIFVAALRQAIQQELAPLTQRVAALEDGVSQASEEHILRVVVSEMQKIDSTLHSMVCAPLIDHLNEFEHGDFLTEVDEDDVRSKVRSILEDATISL